MFKALVANDPFLAVLPGRASASLDSLSYVFGSYVMREWIGTLECSTKFQAELRICVKHP